MCHSGPTRELDSRTSTSNSPSNAFSQLSPTHQGQSIFAATSFALTKVLCVDRPSTVGGSFLSLPSIEQSLSRPVQNVSNVQDAHRELRILDGFTYQELAEAWSGHDPNVLEGALHSRLMVSFVKFLPASPHLFVQLLALYFAEGHPKNAVDVTYRQFPNDLSLSPVLRLVVRIKNHLKQVLHRIDVWGTPI